jgi:hypothetical protein
MEWVKPIVQVEREIRERGMFMLVDPSNNRIMFYGYKRSTADISRIIDSLKGRSQELGKFLIALSSAKGETK